MRTGLLSLLLLLPACAEDHLYSVGLDGQGTRVDENGVPLAAEKPAQSSRPEDPHAGLTMEPAKGPITGTIVLEPSLGVDLSKFQCVFLTARRHADMRMDGVLQLQPPSFPMAFTLSADGSHGGGLTAGTHFLIARLDGDGDAGTTSVGDVAGAVQGVEPGGAAVTLVLDDLLTADELPAQTPAPTPAPTPPFAGGAGGAPETATPEDLAGPRFRGRVELAPEFAALNGKHRLFLILRSPKTEGGMPLAVKAVEAASFPLEFDIGTEAVPLAVENKAEMLGGEVKLFARLSTSGGPTGGSGDIETEPVLTSAGKPPVTLTLIKRRSP